MKVVAHERIELPGAVRRVAGPRLCVGAEGALYEIRNRSLQPLPLPHPDCVPLGLDAEGRLIAGRSSGDRLVRRYRGKSLDGTYPFTLEEAASLAVQGSRVIVVRKDGSALGLDERTVPRVDYAYRLQARIGFVDAFEERIVLVGKETILCDFEGHVLERGAGATRVRLRREGYWRIGDGLRSGRSLIRPSALGLGRIEDVLVGAEEWAIGEALVRFTT